MNARRLKFLPVFLSLNDKKILIVGGGRVALHKISSIQLFTDDITFLALDFSPQINETSYRKIIKPYEKNDLSGYHIIYACTNNKSVNKRIKEDSESMGLLVNVADDPSLCDFISPAVYQKDFITVAVSSNARDVKKAIEIRDKIKQVLEDDTA
jgi:precorrin-2 dehydrogenase / sirohydrochlorin ferrochelatase